LELPVAVANRLRARDRNLDPGPSTASTPRAFLYFLLAVTAVKLLIVRSGWSETTLISDDAFYYFTIARHIVMGSGPTFDGLAPTNGFHPLWLLLLLPLYALAPHSIWSPVRAALAINVLFDTATGWLLFRLVDARLGRRVAWGCAILWLCAPTSAILAFLGMEGSLVTLLLMALMTVTFDTARRERSWRRHAILSGVLWGACALARTDQILLCGAALAWLVVRESLAWRQRLRWFVVTALVAAAVMVPWFAWNKATFGTLEQVSSRAKRHAKGLWGALPNDWSSARGAVVTGTTGLFPPVVVVTRWMSVEDLSHLRVRWTPWLVAATLVPGLALALRGALRMRVRGARDLLAFGIAYLAGRSFSTVSSCGSTRPGTRHHSWRSPASSSLQVHSWTGGGGTRRASSSHRSSSWRRCRWCWCCSSRATPSTANAAPRCAGELTSTTSRRTRRATTFGSGSSMRARPVTSRCGTRTSRSSTSTAW
jgi:hypothetical protein